MKDSYTRAQIYDTLKRGIRIVYPETVRLPDSDISFANLTHVLNKAFKEARKNDGPFWEQKTGGGSKHNTFPLESVAEVMNQIASQLFSDDTGVRNRALRARINSRVLFVTESLL